MDTRYSKNNCMLFWNKKSQYLNQFLNLIFQCVAILRYSQHLINYCLLSTIFYLSTNLIFKIQKLFSVFRFLVLMFHNDFKTPLKRHGNEETT